MTTQAQAPRMPITRPTLARTRLRSLRMPAPELLGAMGLAAVLNLWSLSRNGWANDYYSAAVRSMSSSWHNFLYGSFDASGLMTVDKPPLALWVQALSARIFGFHPLSLLVPQALMGIAAVALVYDLTRRYFGRVGGFVAGLTLALTPMTVAISRHNNPDALLTLCCVAAVWFLVRGLEDGRTRWLVLSGVAIGLGFEAKMAVALMVVPGIAAAWLWLAPNGRGRATAQLLAGGAAMTVVGAAWPVLVWLTPASSRPWISGTGDNSIWSLIFGYNGLGRLDGQTGGPAGGGPGGGNGFFGGSAGPLRLLNQALGGQAGWLLGFAIVAAIGLVVVTRVRRNDARTGWLLAVGGAFATTAIAFSFAKGIFHPYYVSLLAPFSAGLVGAGAGLLAAGDVRWRVFAPLAIFAGVGTEIAVLHGNPGNLTWLPPILVLVTVPAAAVLAGRSPARRRHGALAAALAVLLIAPTAWSFQTLGHATSGTFPSGGPATTGFGGGPGGPGRAAPGPGGPPMMSGRAPSGAIRGGGGPFGGDRTATGAAVDYAKTHGGGTVVVASQSGASGTIIRSGANVAAIGGFSGRESTVSLDWFVQAVRAGKIRWVIAEANAAPRLPGDTRTGSTSVMEAVARVCKKVTTSSGTVYDCQGKADALAKLT